MADVAIANALLSLNQPDRAIEQIGWAVKPPAEPKAIETYARALCMENQGGAAWNMVKSLATQSADWRQRWLWIVADSAPDPVTAAAWIGKVQPLLDPASADEQLRLGQAVARDRNAAGGCRIPGKSRNHRQTFCRLTSATRLSSLLLMGQICQQQNDLPDAEKYLMHANTLSRAKRDGEKQSGHGDAAAK